MSSDDTQVPEVPASTLDPKLIDKLRSQANGAKTRAEANLARAEANLSASHEAAKVAETAIVTARYALDVAERDLFWLDNFSRVKGAFSTHQDAPWALTTSQNDSMTVGAATPESSLNGISPKC